MLCILPHGISGTIFISTAPASAAIWAISPTSPSFTPGMRTVLTFTHSPDSAQSRSAVCCCRSKHAAPSPSDNRRPSHQMSEYILPAVSGRTAFTVIVIVSSCASRRRCRDFSSSSPLVLIQRISCGNSDRSLFSVSNVSGFARGSPGPAIPATRIRLSCWSAFAVRRTASSGVRIVDVTPGRDSLAQSYRRSQKAHWMLHRGATGRWILPYNPRQSLVKQGCCSTSLVISGTTTPPPPPSWEPEYTAFFLSASHVRSPGSTGRHHFQGMPPPLFFSPILLD